MPKDLYKLFEVELICQGDDKNVMKKREVTVLVSLVRRRRIRLFKPL